MDETRTTPKPPSMTIEACPARVEALFHGHIIADSPGAKLLRETGYDPVYYFPREDVEMEKLVRTDGSSHCPLKGDASYFTVSRDGEMIENGAWSYETPVPGAEDIRGMIAFYRHVVDIHVVGRDPDRMWSQEDKIGEYIRHTDSGSGQSQEAHWPPNVSRPDDESGELDEEDARARL